MSPTPRQLAFWSRAAIVSITVITILAVTNVFLWRNWSDYLLDQRNPLAYVPVTIAATCFIRWLYLASRAVVGDAGSGLEPGMAIYGWFVPGANLFWPRRVVADVVRLSAPDPAESRSSMRLVNLWWLAFAGGYWVLSTLVGLVVIRTPSAWLIDWLHIAFLVAAATFAVPMIRRIDGFLQARLVR
ncbi:MAG TPA: hypothetical protein DGT23_27485 [Micromonosporaceae bacterium]|nr:hypothetical protein [Micromonosporaceae bacterium]